MKPDDSMLVPEDAIDGNEQKLDNIVDTLRHYPFVEKMNISQSYISRLEKKILYKLKKDMLKNM